MTDAPPPYNPYAATAIPQAPAGTRTNTPWIWIVVLLPLVQLVPLFFIDWAGFIDTSLQGSAARYSSSSSLALMTSPGYLALSLSGWVIYALLALFAYLDWKQLRVAGVPQPFHFAWVFLSSIVYVIGRSVVVRRRTGAGMAPMWVAIGTLVISFGVVIYISAVMFSAVFKAVQSYNY